MTIPEACPVCEASAANMMELPNGSIYCNVHRGPVVASEATAPPLDIPDVVLPEEAPPETVAAPPAISDVEAAWPHATSPDGADHHQEAVSATTPATSIALAAETATPNEPAPDTDDDDEGGPNIPALKLIIGLCLQAGVMSLDAKNMPLEPPTAWAPPPADQVPEFAAGCAMAVALMIRTFGIEHTDVIALSKQFLDTDTTEESN